MRHEATLRLSPKHRNEIEGTDRPQMGFSPSGPPGSWTKRPSKEGGLAASGQGLGRGCPHAHQAQPWACIGCTQAGARAKPRPEWEVADSSVRRHSVVGGQGRLWVTDLSGGRGERPACILTTTRPYHPPWGWMWAGETPPSSGLQTSGGGGSLGWGSAGGTPGLAVPSGLPAPPSSPWPASPAEKGQLAGLRVHAQLRHPKEMPQKPTCLVGHGRVQS